MKQILNFLLATTVLAVVTDGQYYYSRPRGYYSNSNSYYDQPQPQPYYYYGQGLQHSYGRELQLQSQSPYVHQPIYAPSYGHRYQPMYALHDPYDEYESEWVSPYVVRHQRPSYFWTSPVGDYRRMARKGNKNKNKKKGGGGGEHHEQEKADGGWWYIMDPKKGGCISGHWGKPPPKGLEREHYSQGACGKLGGHSNRVKQQGNKYGVQLPTHYQGGGGQSGQGLGGGGGGQRGQGYRGRQRLYVGQQGGARYAGQYQGRGLPNLWW